MSDPRSIWCRHYVSPLKADACLAGVVFDTLERPRPCVKLGSSPGNWGKCAHFSEYTMAELDEQEREAEKAVADFLGALAEGRCPHCGATVRRRQVGRCVYGEPCGHRLYQGWA